MNWVRKLSHTKPEGFSSSPGGVPCSHRRVSAGTQLGEVGWMLHCCWKYLCSYGLRLRSRKNFPGNVALLWLGGRLICGPFCLKQEFSFGGSQCSLPSKAIMTTGKENQGKFGKKSLMPFSLLFGLIFLVCRVSKQENPSQWISAWQYRGPFSWLSATKENLPACQCISEGWLESKLLI